jgi:hypothetical protein
MSGDPTDEWFINESKRVLKLMDESHEEANYGSEDYSTKTDTDIDEPRSLFSSSYGYRILLEDQRIAGDIMHDGPEPS